MPREQIKGGAETLYLSGSLTNVATSFTVKTTPSSNWPTGTSPFVITVDRGTTSEEKMLVTTRSGTGFNPIATRGYDNTTAVSHTDNATVEHTTSGVMLQEANLHTNDTTRDDHTQYTKKATLTGKGATYYASGASVPALQSAGADNTVLVYASAQANGVIAQQIANAQIDAAAAITLTKMASIADQRILGNNTGSTAAALALTPAQVKTILAVLSTDVSDFTEAVQDVMGALAAGGSGLTLTYNDASNTWILDVNVDSSSIEINADTLRVKAAGITPAMLAASVSLGTLSSGYAQVTANQGSITTITDLTSLTVTVTPAAAGRRFRIMAKVNVSSTVGSDQAKLSILEGATLLNAADCAPVSANQGVGLIATAIIQPSNTAHTYKLALTRSVGSGTFTMNASATEPSFIHVEDIGV